MKIVGLCGGSGSGKGAVCSVFWQMGIPCIDTDAVYRDLTRTNTPCVQALAKEFGGEIINKDGSLNRKALASLVFFGGGADEKRFILNKLSHKFILDECKRRISLLDGQGNRLVILDAPLLFESGFDKECDVLVCVIADRDTRIRRIIARDGITEEEAIRRIDSQIDDKTLASMCDYVIYNNKEISDLHISVETLAEELLK